MIGCGARDRTSIDSFKGCRPAIRRTRNNLGLQAGVEPAVAGLEGPLSSDDTEANGPRYGARTRLHSLKGC